MDVAGITFQMYDDSKDDELPSECELVVDDPKKTVDSFPKSEFRPGKYSYMNAKNISYVMRKLKEKYKETCTSLYIDKIEEVK